jgi:hypothetical protein
VSHVIPKSRHQHYVIGTHVILGYNVKYIAVVLWHEIDKPWKGTVCVVQIGQIVDDSVWAVLTYNHRVELERLRLSACQLWIVDEELISNSWEGDCRLNRIIHYRAPCVVS